VTDAIPRWRRLEADERREQILDCATRLFGERPYALVSTTEIARAAGVARGLLNHYFGTKRDLYLAVVRRLVRLPDFDATITATGPLAHRVERSVDWFLDAVAAHGKTYVAVTGAEGVAADPVVERIIAEADDAAARGVLSALGVDTAEHGGAQRAIIRAYSGLVKAAMREWIREGTLTRAQVHLLLSRALVAIVRDVLPAIGDAT
jgi:AcrR family transcriptional regulator